MPENGIAMANVIIDASRERVWAALTNPELIRQYMLGSTLTAENGTTRVQLTQDNNAGEAEADHSAENWK